MTFSATYTIFANLKLTENSIFFFTFFRVFSAYFVDLHAKFFSPKINLEKYYEKKVPKVWRQRESDLQPTAPQESALTTAPLLCCCRSVIFLVI